MASELSQKTHIVVSNRMLIRVLTDQNLKQNMKNRTKLYTLEHPLTGEVRYVGKTSMSLSKRLWDHMHPKPNEHTHKNNWIKSLKKQGLKVVIKELEVSDYWKQDETYWIAQFRAWGFRLTNSDYGGMGHVGSKPAGVCKFCGKGYYKYSKTSEYCSRSCAASVKGKNNRSPKPTLRKSVLQLNLKGEIIKEYKSVRLAALAMGNINLRQNISKCALGKTSKNDRGYTIKHTTCAGHKWAYKTDYEKNKKSNTTRDN